MFYQDAISPLYCVHPGKLDIQIRANELRFSNILCVAIASSDDLRVQLDIAIPRYRHFGFIRNMSGSYRLLRHFEAH